MESITSLTYCFNCTFMNVFSGCIQVWILKVNVYWCCMWCETRMSVAALFYSSVVYAILWLRVGVGIWNSEAASAHYCGCMYGRRSKAGSAHFNKCNISISVTVLLLTFVKIPIQFLLIRRAYRVIHFNVSRWIT